MKSFSKAMGIITLISLFAMAGCGGGGAKSDSTGGTEITSGSGSSDVNPNSIDNNQQDNQTPAAPEDEAPAAPEDENPQYPVGGTGNYDGRTNDNDATPAITTVYIKEMSGRSSGSSNTPITFGHIFAKGDIPAGQSIQATLANDVSLPIQVDKKATYDDGSLKHAVISAFIPQLDLDEKARIYLNTSSTAGDDTPLNLSALLATDFDSVITITESGTTYTASAADLLNTSAEELWLSGQTVSEWIVSSPMKDSQNNAHPHLQARFNVRAYSGFDSVRVSVILENNWSYEPNPTNFTYDLDISVAGETVLQQNALEHYHHARFRRVFWWGEQPRISANYKTSYLKATKSIPNYDPSVTMTETALESTLDIWELNDDLMQIGTLTSYMPSTGGREDYGVLPGWTASYLISQDDRAKVVMLGNSEQAGTWSIHYRDKNTDLPLSIDDYPHCGLYGNTNDKFNSTAQRSEEFPACLDCYGDRAWAGKTVNDVSVADLSHQPSIAYIPYMITGDYYHLEEQLFWTSYNFIQANPYYRGLDKGYAGWDQTRGQAWSLRTLGQTAFIIPDDHPMKGYFKEKLDNNRDWYQANYVDDTQGYAYANDIGWIGYSWDGQFDLDKDGENDTSYGLVSPWMNDFFTAAIGHVIELGFDNWNSVMQWQGRFPVGRLYGTDFCSTMATSYMFAAGDNRYGPFYSWEELYINTATIEVGAEVLDFQCGSAAMMSYLSDTTGYNFTEGMLYEKYLGSTKNYMTRYQGAVAYAVDNNVTNAQEAWDIFSNRDRATDFTDNPRYAIIPR